MSDEELKSNKMVEVLYDLSTKVKVLETRVDALVSLIEFLVDNLPGDELEDED